MTTKPKAKLKAKPKAKANKNAKPKVKRDYNFEYQSYHGTPEQRKRRAGRNAARRKMEKLGLVKPGDGKDVHHANHDTTDNRKKNLKVISRTVNRGKLRIGKKK